MFNRNKQNQNNGQNPFGTFGERMMPYPNNQYQMNPAMSSNYQLERFQYEIKENRRRINNLAKRVIRLENYLRIKDTEEFIDEDGNNLGL